MSYLTCDECIKKGDCIWTKRGCQAPVEIEPPARFEGYALHGIGMFFYFHVDKNFVMDDFGTATSVPPPTQRWPFNEDFEITAP